MSARRSLLATLLLVLLAVSCADDRGSGAAAPPPPLSTSDPRAFAPLPPPGDEAEVFLRGGDLVLANRHVGVRYHLTEGLYDVVDAHDRPVVLNAQARIQSHVLVPRLVWRSSDPGGSSWSAEHASTPLGDGMSVTVRRAIGTQAPLIEQTFTVLDGQSAVLLSARATNLSGAMRIGAIYPLETHAARGELLFGKAEDLRVLTSGVANYLDFIVPIRPGTEGTLSNWNSLFFNQARGTSLLVGFLSFEKAQPVVYNARTASGGQVLQADCEYDPALTIPHGGSLDSETLVLDFGQATPWEALETYADRLRAWLGIQTYPDRHPEVGIPAGWNSWTGSSSSGGYGQDIDEGIILANMDFADRELRRWGMNYFQIDDGWQDEKGDWGVNEARFPPHGNRNGVAWLMDRARALGFRTGLWIQGFHASPESRVFQEHPDWFADFVLGGIGQADAEPVFDLSHPEARAHLAGVLERLLSWGVQWVKLDFAYRALLTEGWHDPEQTRIGFYRSGVALFREVLGDDVFLLNVAVVGPNYDLIDSCRLTLDTMPVWDGEAEDPDDPIQAIENQGLKPMYRDAARRYYLNGRVWVNHPDLIFFRAHANPQYPPLTLDESRTFLSAVALQGGLVKLGDRLVDLSPEAVDSIRRILPANERTGRPLDLFRREFPEVWSLPVPDFPEPYHVLGILNWGRNRDLTHVPFAEVADQDREIAVDFREAELDPETAYLAFEFWTEEFLGEVSGSLSLEVPARTPRIVFLREKKDRPQLLGTNRHLLGGRGVIRELTWNDAERSLSAVQEGAVGTSHAPFVHHIYLHVPPGYRVRDVQVVAPEGYAIADQLLSDAGPVVELSFRVVELPGTCGPPDVCRHPDVIWTAFFDRVR